MPHAIFYGPEKYQGLNVYNPYFLQGITHVMILIQESVLQSQTIILLREYAEALELKLEFLSLLPAQNVIERPLPTIYLTVGTKTFGNLCHSQNSICA